MPKPSVKKQAGQAPKLRKWMGKYLPSYLGLLPFFALLVTFVLVPMIYGLAMSFTDWSASSRGEVKFVGLENYLYVLGGEGTTSIRFLKSLRNLAIFVPVTVVVGLSISLILALVVNNLSGRLHRFFRGAYFVPTVLPLFLCTGIWLWFMNADTGLVATALAKIGIGVGVNWANSPGYAIAMVVLIDIWNAIGFNFIIFNTGMQDISPELYEAAEIDGASTFKKMTRITIPMMEPIIFFVVVYSFISALQVYDIPWILTNTHQELTGVGGPNQVMLFPVMEMVRNVYSGGASGLARASAQGTILMLIIMLVTLVQFVVRRKKT